MEMKKQTHIADLLFTLALFLVFAASVVMALLFGANVYQNTVRQMDENYNQRTCLAYVANQVRQHDAAGRVYLSEITGQPALILEDGDWDGRYFTAIYWYEGSLRELYTAKDSGLTAADGVELLTLTAFSMWEEDGLLRVEAIGPQGEKLGLTLSLRSMKGGEDR